MTDARVTFRGFDVIRVAVDDFGSAVASWRDQLGWRPSAVSAGRATFPLDGASIDLSPTAQGQLPGVTGVSVMVDDTELAAQRIESAGFSVARTADGAVSLPARELNGLALELRQVNPGTPSNSTGPYKRINHVVVAVDDDAAALQNWSTAFGSWPPLSMDSPEHANHVPVGIGWFGLTSSGTNAGAVQRFLDRRGQGVYAVGLVVNDWARTLESLRRNGARLLTDEHSNQTFVHPATTHGVLIQVMAEWWSGPESEFHGEALANPTP
jgi:4-hydroxyphenylpyruvate dioxygenase-like putative hemolysin